MQITCRRIAQMPASAAVEPAPLWGLCLCACNTPWVGCAFWKAFDARECFRIDLSGTLSSDCDFMHVPGFPRSYRSGETREKMTSSLDVISTTAFALYLAHRVMTTELWCSHAATLHAQTMYAVVNLGEI